MELLERDDLLHRLRTALDEASTGTGRLAVIAGEPGIGKTALVDAFAAGSGVRPLRGACDDLLTPRPLGPFRDLARRASDEFRQAVTGGQAVTAFVDELARGVPPRLAIIEDIHWADEASLDVLTYTCRRIAEVPALLVLTYRRDDLEPDHPLTALLGRLPPTSTIRLEVEPLSVEAIASMVDGDMARAGTLHEVSAGNPFFVTELLAGEGISDDEVPVSIREAVLARVARLPDATRDLLQFVAVVPRRVETSVLARCHPAWTDDAIPAERLGVLTLVGHSLAFRHELARQAVLDTLPALRARQLHADVLVALTREDEVDAARVVHHAKHAGDAAAIVEFAPRAAREAAASDAHREAIAHYDALTPYTPMIADDEVATLYEEAAHEYFLLGRGTDALTARGRALALRKQLGDPIGTAANLRWLAYLSWWFDDRPEAERQARLAQDAIADATGEDADAERARVHALSSQLAMLAQRWDEAEAAGALAIELAERSGDIQTLVNALNNVGVGRYAARGQGPDTLEQALALALEHDLHDAASRAYINLGFCAVLMHDHDRWQRVVDAGIVHLTDHQLLTSLPDLMAMKARLMLELGDWEEADRTLEVVADPSPNAGTSHVAIETRARLLVRRGDPAAASAVAATINAANRSGEPYRIGPAAVVAAEFAWLASDMDDATCALLDRAGQMVQDASFAWLIGEVAVWRQRAGRLAAVPDGAAEPYVHLLAGRHLDAAKCWEDLGAPYEQADALAATGDPDHMVRALDLLDALGAKPLAARTRAALRDLGVRSVPRGPATSTRQNPAGLTDRQLEVLQLLTEGLTNAEIAEDLVVSVRTVDHHVSAVLQKLGVGSRAEAARAAEDLDLTD